MSNKSTPSNEPAFEPDTDTIERYLAGECTEAEVDVVGKWLQRELPESAGLKALEGYVLDRANVPSLDLGGVKARLHEEARRGRGGVGSKSSLRTLPRWTGYSTLVVLLVIALWPLLRRVADSTPTYKTYTTIPGQRARIQLPDGSVALLAPASKMRYADNRKIELEGQALFTVVQAAGSPFIVRIRGAETKVLGTSFTVRRYASDSITRVVVAEGKVAVSNSISGQIAVLTTGDQADIKSNGGISSKRISDVAAALAWTQGKLEFTRTPLLSVVADAERMYGVKIKISSKSLANQLVTGVIDQLSPNEALHLLAAILGVSVERDGNTFTLMER